MLFDAHKVQEYCPTEFSHIDISDITHLAIAAHPDDIEIIGLHGIGQCLNDSNSWFSGIVVTDGAGSPRSGKYKDITNENMVDVRAQEQIIAADVGQYASLYQLRCSSHLLKGELDENLVSYLYQQLLQMKPDTLYLHNPADRHETHVNVCLHAIAALQRLAVKDRPTKVYGVEVWRSLDWLPENFKVTLDVSSFESLQIDLFNAFESQVDGGKKYDTALVSRWRSNATFYDSHSIDTCSAMQLAMDMTTLMSTYKGSVKEFMLDVLKHFNHNVIKNL